MLPTIGRSTAQQSSCLLRAFIGSLSTCCANHHGGGVAARGCNKFVVQYGCFVPSETRKGRETELLRNKNSFVKGRMTGNVFVIKILSLNKHNKF